MRRKLIAGLIVALAAPWSQAAVAQPSDYTLLGEEIANYQRETDRFAIGGERGVFRALKLEVERAAIQLFDVVVTFGNGQKRSLGRERRIDAGSAGYVLDLPGDGRRIKHVDVTYRSLRRSTGRRAIVELSGQKLIVRDPDFERLASVTGDLRDEQINIDIKPDSGRFDAIKLAVGRRDVYVRRIVIAYRNGDVQTLRINDWIDEGRPTKAIELTRSGRRLRSVTVVTRPSRSRDIARFDILGKRSERRSPADDGRFGPQPRVDRGGEPIGFDRVGTMRIPLAGGSRQVDVGRSAGRVRRLAIRATRNEVFIRRIIVTYGNGQRDPIVVQKTLRDGYVSPVIRLDGARFVREVDVEAQSRPGRRPGRLVVYISNDDRKLRKEPAKPEWVSLGVRRPRRFKSETHVIEVGRDVGRLKAFRMTIEKHDVRFRGLRVVFGNGSEQVIPFYAKIDDGVTTNPFALESNGRGRFVARIFVTYNTSPNFKGNGLVQFWGLRD